MREDHWLTTALLGPDFDLAVPATTGQLSFRQHRKSDDTAALRQNHRLAFTLLGPDFDPSVCAAAGQLSFRHHRQSDDTAALRQNHPLPPPAHWPHFCSPPL